MTLNRQSLARHCAVVASAIFISLLSACATLPEPAQREPSTAIADYANTRLGRISAANLPTETSAQSGFRLLPSGDHALSASLALADRAEKSIDVQTYLLAPDPVGLAFLRSLRDAAARGVRVRLLVDDFYAANTEQLLADFAACPGVQVRLFNPLPSRAPGALSRFLLSLGEFGRINHRMHNKLFVADNSFAVSGGRNMAEEYFMRASTANFIDMDVVSTGPIVRDMSRVFDLYWNSPQAYPIESLVSLDANQTLRRQRFEAALAAAGPAPVPRPLDPLGRTPLVDQLNAGKLDISYAGARVLADTPGKALGLGDDALRATTFAQTMDAFLNSHQEVVMASPYLIPGERGLALMARAAQFNVKLTVLTNGYGATDEPLAHLAYSRYRRAMLKLGVNIYELSPTLSRQSGKLGDFRSSFGRLHAKVAVIDRQRIFIGSLNLDGRSARVNTEMGLLIDSPQLAKDAIALLANDDLRSAYRLRLGADGEAIEWIAKSDAGETVHTEEPETDWKLRLRDWLLTPLVSEDLL